MGRCYFGVSNGSGVMIVSALFDAGVMNYNRGLYREFSSSRCGWTMSNS